MYSFILGRKFASFVKPVHAVVKEERSVVKNQEGTISILQLNSHVWVHTELGYFNVEAVPSNGLFLKTSEELVLIDSSWDDNLTKELIEMRIE